ncbi:MAG: glycoside hydrolase family 3 protein, partial [Deltaproteobacteria bacterium]|nr:glycoside hydrolase family 3 protein [Deltaproteobacteria bacterium]
MKPLVAVFALVLALALIPFALDWRSPFLVDMRPWLFRGLIVISSSLMLAQFCVMRTSRPGQLVIGVISATGLVAAGVVLISTLALEGRFHWVRHHVLRADP